MSQLVYDFTDGYEIIPCIASCPENNDCCTNPLLLISLQSGNSLTLGSDNKLYVSPSAGGGTWGTIGGYLPDQTDLQTVLDTKYVIPTQSGNAGKFLTTNGSSASWATVNSAVWGNITGTLSAQIDLNTALGLLAPLASPTFTGTVVLPSTTSIGSVTNTELSYLSGVTSAIQTQLDAKQASITGGATTITSSNLTASRALSSDASGKVSVATTTLTELNYVNGVTSAIQTQLDSKLATSAFIPAGSNTQLQFNNSGAFGASANLTWNGTTFNVSGLTTFTPANSTATTGTVNSLSHTSTFAAATGSANFRPLNISYTLNNSGAQTGTSTGIFLNATESNLNGMTHNLMDLQIGGTSMFRVTRIGQATLGSSLTVGSFISAGSQISTTYTSTLSTPAFIATGTWFTGGNATTTKPHVLIEPTSTTSTNWSTNGTGLGVNAASSFTGNLIDLQLNGSSKFSIASNGAINTQSVLNLGSTLTAGGNVWAGTTLTIGLSGRSRIASPNDGDLLLTNQAQSDFGLLQFGGITSSYPAIRRNGTSFEFKLADNSASCNISASNITALGGMVAYSTIEGYNSGQAGSFTGNVRVGAGSTNNASAVLDVVSTTRGFLPPRMNTTAKNAISSPAAGLVVYDTTLNKLCVYTGAAWETITSV